MTGRYPPKDPRALTEIHERIFGQRNRDVNEARASVLDAARAGGAGLLDALEEVVRAVEMRSANDLREHNMHDAADLLDQIGREQR